MSVLAFGATATIGDLRYEQNISEAQVALALAPGIGSARIVLPRDLRVDASPGDEVEVQLRGEADEPVQVFTGTVHSARRGMAQTTVLCGDAAAALAAIRTGATFEQQSASAVIEALAREAGVSIGSVDLDLELATYVAHQGRTALEHVSTLAAWAGGVVSTNPEGAIEVRQFPSPPADAALRYGREIAELSVMAPTRAADVVFAGSGPAGSASAPNARKLTTGIIPDGAPGPSASAIRVAAPALRTPSAASGASEAAAARNGVPRLAARCWLLPSLRAGSTVEIADAPAGDAQGPWIITKVRHQVGPGARGVTTFEASSLEASGGGLLGQLLGAIGSLL